MTEATDLLSAVVAAPMEAFAQVWPLLGLAAVALAVYTVYGRWSA